ncbi:hypothetical protein HNR22_000186 [Micromonospora jinlongensis]|uniref:Uncharacterized protein n=1 Tax=Micromonospora jinlongensis TaxID=1287877 RepID=A0A7Y9WVY5_9ACTN|nr:DUF5988 family protein [Micromonospora jinlongensis]NYH40459.1 hypothetical protein [Micromonospora jinlongensis]
MTTTLLTPIDAPTDTFGPPAELSRFLGQHYFSHDAANPATNPPLDFEKAAFHSRTVVTAEQLTSVVQVNLVGGPSVIPRSLVVSKTLAANEKLKICHLDGYEHFERDAELGNVFVWSMRTSMAF